jgi:hypothetical protein
MTPIGLTPRRTPRRINRLKEIVADTLQRTLIGDPRLLDALVFTLPHELHPLLLHNQQTLYKLLFDAAAQSLLDFARTRLEGAPGITAVLHT